MSQEICVSSGMQAYIVEKQVRFSLFWAEFLLCQAHTGNFAVSNSTRSTKDTSLHVQTGQKCYFSAEGWENLGKYIKVCSTNIQEVARSCQGSTTCFKLTMPIQIILHQIRLKKLECSSQLYLLIPCTNKAFIPFLSIKNKNNVALQESNAYRLRNIMCCIVPQWQLISKHSECYR